MTSRGMCPSCGNQARLRADGTTGAHGGSPGAMLKGFVTAILPFAVLCDIDGTVALRGDRSPFDWHRVGEDEPNRPVIEVVRALRADEFCVIFMSGRSDECRDATARWLDEHVGAGRGAYALHMRAAGDFRKDAIVKAELFDRHVRGRYNVRVVLDDRNQVVDMWRSLGLTCLQVAPGDF